jgi:hypothetical protein
VWLRFGRIAFTLGAGLSVGYLLAEIYARHNFLPNSLLSLIVNKSFAVFLAGLVGDHGSARDIMMFLVTLLQAVPGGLVLGACAGLVLGRIRHPLVLGSGVLAWPLVHFLALLIMEWGARQGAGMKMPSLDNRLLAGWTAVYSIFFISMYIVDAIIRRWGPARSNPASVRHSNEENSHAVL